ncbi:hypothetical protein DICPUDRAFT_90419 [Dictyostelium purpureum]|uniref:Uncharacterized protein n=1 Tax=Dictyostelium purpureum TaxID=5786 RepID=F1A2H4_DICPU|nr:uncharacterized protein DICPUDRAFT_90419 [Dictyostelium purpureum]EGC29599.1 hypothetical protein DICPUDRAFT_90419 [Dictyostelium purpureum]|eukprot:XP_003293867.1 hypothetical protein DICPUDRAFT_90419 [Dictyostelium purpureum]
MALPISTSITNPSPTVIIIASVLVLFGIVAFIPESEDIYSVYSLDDDDNNINNKNKNKRRNNNINHNNNNNNNNNNINNNNNNNNLNYNFSSSSISSSTSSIYTNNKINNNNDINSNTIDNTNRLLGLNQELMEQIHAERSGRIIAEKKHEESTMLLHSLQKEMVQREEFEKKLLQLCTIEIKKKKQYQDSLGDLSEQISHILDTISNQSLIVNKNNENNNVNNIDNTDNIDSNKSSDNMDTNIHINNDKILISIDSNLVSQFEGISNIIKSLQQSTSSNMEINNQHSDTHLHNQLHLNIDNNNNNNNYPTSEESLYLELVKISKNTLPFQFSDIISN